MNREDSATAGSVPQTCRLRLISRRLSNGGIAARTVLIAVCLFAAACSGKPGGGTAQPGHTLHRAIKTGVVRVGYANEAPYAYMDGETGRLTGEAPEVARVILGQMGIKRIVGVLTEFGSLIPGLQAHRFDLIAAGMYILPKRCKQIAFANPTYSMGDSFLVSAGNPKNLHGYGDVVKNSNVRLGVVVGTVEQRYANRLGVPAGRLVIFPDTPSALAGVQSGRIDAFAGTSLTVRRLLEKARDDGVTHADPFHDPVIGGRPARGYGAFGFRKSDEDFRAAFNERLAKFIGTPEYFKIMRRFGFTRANLPGNVTAKELCRGN